ncbi:MAG: ABC transporter ATP-binding protein, partial [Pedosphaera sp.]|nr:ABC transporter ATP-binding protein [Pedosphaera sp.]
KLSTPPVHVKNGPLRNFPGGYDYYHHKTNKENAARPATNGAPSKSTNKTEDRARKRAEAEARNARSRERRKIEKEVQRLEKEIQAAEAKITELTEELEKPETYDNAGRAVAINRDLSTAQTTLDCLTPDWEKAAEKLEALG